MKKKEIKTTTTTTTTTIKPSLKIIIQCQRVIPAEPNLIIKCDQHKMI